MNSACIITGMPQPKNEHDFWIERIKMFRQHFGEGIDVIVSVDGSIPAGIDGIICLNHDDVKGACPCMLQYDGWVRNMIDALEYSMNYRLCAWIDSDVLIQNKRKFLDKFCQEEYFGCGVAYPYNFADTAFMILNSREKRRDFVELIRKYEKGIMELYVAKFFEGHVDFSGYRRERFEQDLRQYDYISQIFNCADYRDFLQGR